MTKLAPVEHESIIGDGTRHFYVVTNGLASVGELVTGIISGNPALALDGSHGSLEIVIGNEQMKDAAHTHEVSESRQKKIYSALFGFALVGAAVATKETFSDFEVGVYQPAIATVGVISSAIAASSAGIAAGRILRGVKRKYGKIFRGFHLNPEVEQTERDMIKHIVELDAPSSVMALGASALALANGYAVQHGHEPFAPDLDSAIGMASGAWGMWLFRPTKNNLAHGHIEHDPVIEESLHKH